MDESEHNIAATMDESEHNIGAYGNQCMFSDEEHTLFNNHEDAAFDYCTPSDETVPSNTNAEERVNVPPTDNVNGLHGLQRINVINPSSFISRIGESETAIRCYVNEGGLKARRKVEKIKKKKAAGWKTANDLEGHKDFAEVGDVLDFLGVAEYNDTASLPLQKKKLKKRTKHKTGSKSDRTTSVNGKCSQTSSTTSDSDQENNDRYASELIIANNTSSMNGTADEPHSKHNDQVFSSDNSLPSTSSVVTPDDSIYNGLDLQATPDEEFKEVHRRKKVVHRQHSTQTEQPKSASSNRVFNKPNRHESKSTVPTTRSKTAPTPEVTMDLSLNSFPVLESQYFVGVDGKQCAYTESTRTSLHTESATDDDRDSVASQSTSHATNSQRSSWAKIAAKPTCSMHTSNHEQSSIADTCTSKSLSSNGDGDPSYQKAVEFSQTDQPSPMSRSTSAVSEIEFGTVTSSDDVKTDQRVQDILSHSFTDAQTRFKLCSQSKNISKSMKTSSARSSKLKAKQRRNTKGVEFFDQGPNPLDANINIVFGFDEPHDKVKEAASLAEEGVSPSTTSSPRTIFQNNIDVCSTPIDTSTLTSINDNDSLPQSADVLPQILSTSYSKDANHEQAASYDYNGNFNLANAVLMLKKEWNSVLELRKKHGDESVKLSAELLSN